jgi:hypothetical protein
MLLDRGGRSEMPLPLDMILLVMSSVGTVMLEYAILLTGAQRVICLSPLGSVCL